MVRFMTRGSEHGECGVVITRWGTEINNEVIVEKLRKSPNNGVFFYEVEDQEKIKKDAVEFAKQILSAHDAPATVEPISGINDEEMEKELAAAAENERLKQERVREEEALWVKKKAETPIKKKG